LPRSIELHKQRGPIRRPARPRDNGAGDGWRLGHCRGDKAQCDDEAREQIVRIDKVRCEDGGCRMKIGDKPRSVRQLREMHREFEVDEPAVRQFDVERAERWFMRCDVGAHCHDIAGERMHVARAGHDIGDQRGERGPRRR